MSLTDAERQAITDLVATWPPLTQDQKDAIRLSFGPNVVGSWAPGDPAHAAA